MRSCPRLFVLLALACAALAGCRHAAASPSPGEGTSTHRFLEPPPPPEKKAPGTPVAKLPTEQILNPRPILPLAEPLYPAAALVAHAGLATVAVRVTIDTNGRVSDIRESLLNLSMPSPVAAEFRAAVDAAVRQWRFRPGEMIHLELVQHPDGDFPRLKSRENVEWAFDVEFTFRAGGDVLTRLPK